jgi:hypothetical protein
MKNNFDNVLLLSKNPPVGSGFSHSHTCSSEWEKVCIKTGNDFESR